MARILSALPGRHPSNALVQLMSEHRSRLNACNTTAGWELDFYRVDRAKGPFLPRHLWRKSSQVRKQQVAVRHDAGSW